MFGVLLTLGFGAATLGGAFVASGSDQQARKKAEANGEVYYVDHNHKWRAVSTNEIVMMNYCDPRYNGHDILEGCETYRVYKDYTADKLKAENDRLEREGRPWRYKEMPHNYADHGSKDKTPWRSVFMAWDVKEGRPISLKLNAYYRFMSGEQSKRWIMEYYSLPNECAYPKVVKTKYMTDEESKEYEGCRLATYRNF